MACLTFSLPKILYKWCSGRPIVSEADERNQGTGALEMLNLVLKILHQIFQN